MRSRLANAGELAGLVIAQLKREGAPIILTGGVNDMLDMRTTVDSYADPNNRVMLVELAHSYDLPIFGLAGCSDSKVPDEQAAAEAAFSIILETLAGSQMMHDVGYLEGGMCNSIEQIVICDELIAYTKQFMKGLEVNEETLALDLIDEIGPHGDFMGSDHTREHYRRTGIRSSSTAGRTRTGPPAPRRCAPGTRRRSSSLSRTSPSLCPRTCSGPLDEIVEQAK